MSARRTLAAIAVAVLAAVSIGSPAGPARAEDCTIPVFRYRHGIVVLSEHGATVNLRVEVADTERAREVGLMCRRALDPDAGMLFVFEDVTREPFWMKNTLIPLSIAFLDSRWHAVGIFDMRVAPNPFDPPPGDIWAPSRPYQYALEVNQGFFKVHGLDDRAQFHFTPSEPAKP